MRKTTYGLCILLTLAACDQFPRDPEKTLHTIRSEGRLMVGITENRPFTDLSSEEPQGVEVTILHGMARELGAQIRWKTGSEAQLMEALSAGELAVVIGGLSDTSPWTDKAGFTRPYQHVKLLVGVPQGAPLPDHIRHRKIGVEPGSKSSQYVLRKGGIPYTMDSPEDSNGYVAGYEWQLHRMKKQISSIELTKENKVFAVPPGENAWVCYLEGYFYRHRKQIADWLYKHHEEDQSL